MNRFDALLRELLDAVSLRLPGSFSWFGMPFSLRGGAGSSALTTRLYASFYCLGAASPVERPLDPVHAGPSEAFVAACLPPTPARGAGKTGGGSSEPTAARWWSNAVACACGPIRRCAAGR